LEKKRGAEEISDLLPRPRAGVWAGVGKNRHYFGLSQCLQGLFVGDSWFRQRGAHSLSLAHQCPPGPPHTSLPRALARWLDPPLCCCPPTTLAAEILNKSSPPFSLAHLHIPSSPAPALHLQDSNNKSHCCLFTVFSLGTGGCVGSFSHSQAKRSQAPLPSENPIYRHHL
jgi:hypothetical protein